MQHQKKSVRWQEEVTAYSEESEADLLDVALELFGDDVEVWVQYFLKEVPEEKLADAIRPLREMLDYFDEHGSLPPLPRHLKILELIKKAREPSLVFDIAQWLEHDRRTISKDLGILERRGLVRKHGERQGYSITKKGNDLLSGLASQCLESTPNPRYASTQISLLRMHIESPLALAKQRTLSVGLKS